MATGKQSLYLKINNMYSNKQLAGAAAEAKAHIGYIETDPNGRYGRVSFNFLYTCILILLYDD